MRLGHGDAWQELGQLFADRGGGVAEYRGVRLMASGLPHPQWNSGDVHAAEVDLESVRSFYAARNVPWGLRVPSELVWAYGRRVLHLRLMGLTPSEFRPSQPSEGLRIDVAGSAHLESVLHVDAAAFGSVADDMRPWLEALLKAPRQVVTVARAVWRDVTVATGYLVTANGLAGRSGYVAGIAVLPGYRRRGFGGGLSSWLVQRALDAGAALIHLHPDDDRAARLYARLGFVETAGLDIYVGV